MPRPIYLSCTHTSRSMRPSLELLEITCEATVSTFSSPYFLTLRDCRCLVRCQVSVCHKFIGQKSASTRRVVGTSLDFRSHPVSRSVRPASAESTSLSMQTSLTGALTPNTWPRSRVGADVQWRASEARTCPIAPVCVCVCVCVFVSACVCVRRTARPAPTLVSVPRTAGGRKYEVGGAS